MHARARTHTAALVQKKKKKKKKAAGRVTLTCGSTDAVAAPPFCLEKQKEAMGGRRWGGRQDDEGGMQGGSQRWMDGWKEGGREGECGGTRGGRGWRVVNERAEWLS